MLREYIPVLFLFGLSLAFAAMMVMMSNRIGARRPTPVKEEPYESGILPLGDTRQRFAVKYYVVAILFLVFDVEVVFLFAWGVVFRKLGWFGFLAIMIFLTLLIVGLVYEWKKGALDWD